MKLKIYLIVVLALSSGPLIADALRGEIQRYTLMNDRFIIDKDLLNDKYSNFLDLDLIVSSGLKSLVGEVSDGTDTANTALEKQLNMFAVLSKYVNTERFVNIDIIAGLPLPDIKINKYRLYPSAFFHLNLGLSLSFSNQESVTNPKASTYIKKDQKMGFYIFMIPSKTTTIKLALYKLSRADLLSAATSASLATDGELFSFSDLSKNQNSINTDISYTKKSSRYEYLVETKELKLAGLSSDKKSLYGSRPLLNIRYARPILGTKVNWKPFAGVHYRRWYSITDGLYIGTFINYYKNSPFSGAVKFSNQFITILPQFSTRFFKFSYRIKSPFRNPRGGFWSASIHNINISLPLP